MLSIILCGTLVYLAGIFTRLCLHYPKPCKNIQKKNTVMLLHKSTYTKCWTFIYSELGKVVRLVQSWNLPSSESEFYLLPSIATAKKEALAFLL